MSNVVLSILFMKIALILSKVDVPLLARKYILENLRLYKRILRYESVLLEEILGPLKNLSCKVTAAALRDYLDDQVRKSSYMGTFEKVPEQYKTLF